jgi:cell division protein FtsL
MQVQSATAYNQIWMLELFSNEGMLAVVTICYHHRQLFSSRKVGMIEDNLSW